MKEDVATSENIGQVVPLNPASGSLVCLSCRLLKYTLNEKLNDCM